MHLFDNKKNGQESYTELIRNSTGKWPNWDPAKAINAGDFGTFNERTEEFRIHGNIYTHDGISEIAKKYVTVQGDESDIKQIESDGVKRLPMDAGDEFGKDVTFQAQWESKRDRAAVLIMHQPRMTCVPEEFFIAALHVPILKGMWVVNQVWKCPGFYLHHATSRGKITVRLHENSSSPGVGNHTFWSREGNFGSGVCQIAYQPEWCFTPLYDLRLMIDEHRSNPNLQTS